MPTAIKHTETRERAYLRARGDKVSAVFTSFRELYSNPLLLNPCGEAAAHSMKSELWHLSEPILLVSYS